MSEQAYLDLLKDVLQNGVQRSDRTGVGTRGVFGRQIRFDLNAGFPLLTTKRIYTRAMIVELLWFLSGSTNVRWLQENGCSIWDEWADENGDLGPVYGKQWRSWPGKQPWPNEPAKIPDGGMSTFVASDYLGQPIDQIKKLIDGLRNDPYSRRHIVAAWNPAEIPDMALPPCHCLFQFFVADGKLSCQLYQRSADAGLGVPFNIASYALLTMMVAQQVDLQLGEFVHTFGDLHIYNNHVDQLKEQLTRTPFPFPRMEIRKAKDIFSYTYEDFTVLDYQYHPTIKMPVAV